MSFYQGSNTGVYQLCWMFVYHMNYADRYERNIHFMGVLKELLVEFNEEEQMIVARHFFT